MWSVVDIVICEDKYIDLYIIDTVFRNIINDITNPIFSIYRQSDLSSAHGVSLKIRDCDINYLYDTINDNNVIKKLVRDGCIQEINKTRKKNICDPMWPLHVRTSWHLFSHGLSYMFLKQIESLRKDIPSHKTYKKVYKRIDKELSNDFEEYASHYICHLASSLYGFSKMSFKV